jgi:hypothetical protein
MSDWVHSYEGKYGRLGLLLNRFGGFFVGLGVAQIFPSTRSWLGLLISILGVALVWFAWERATSVQTIP